MSAQIDFEPYAVQSFDPISHAWLPFVFAMNSVNRVMGTRDLDPFVLSPSALIKLDFIHWLIHDRALEARKRVVSRGGDDCSETENCLKSHASAAGRLRSHGMRVGVDVVTYPAAARLYAGLKKTWRI